MLPPIKCYSCGEPISIHWMKFVEYMRKKNYDPLDMDSESERTMKDFFERDDIDLRDICCRRTLVMTIVCLDMVI